MRPQVRLACAVQPAAAPIDVGQRLRVEVRSCAWMCNGGAYADEPADPWLQVKAAHPDASPSQIMQLLAEEWRKQRGSRAA